MAAPTIDTLFKPVPSGGPAAPAPSGRALSNLSSPKYGYDFVVATTQASINATMKQYLCGLPQPEVILCYVADPKGNPTPIDYNTLMKNAGGSDPFAVPPDADPSSDPNLQNLYKARFMVGFKAMIGLPPGYAPTDIPDILALGADTSAVSYNLMCSEFIVVQFTPASGYGGATWMSQSQPPGAAWLFSSKVDLRLEPSANFGALPPAVQAKIKNLGADAFSVKQLLFDLNNAALETIPTISGVDPASDLYLCLQKYFVGAYLGTLKKHGEPVLGCAVTMKAAPASSLAMTDLNFMTAPLLGPDHKPIPNPNAGQRDAAMLSYLCAANGKPLPAPAPFAWNWLEESEDADCDGVIAINRNTLAGFFKAELDPYVRENCYKPSATVSLDKLSEPVYSAKMVSGQIPKVRAYASAWDV